MRTLIILFLVLNLNNCTKNNEQYIKHLNGYWEIQSVTMPNGEKKDYNINKTIDFIFINDSLKGYRKKLSPTFNGKYKTSEDFETIQLKTDNNNLNIYYSTKYDTWKETVIRATKEILKIKTKNNTIYLYKRFTPIHID